MLDVPSLRARMLAWYRAHRRDLPWRRTADPYAVWISEVMLQQTRVETVIPYYQRFLERWPDVRALAAADPTDVHAAWSGLGYYRRARLMLDAATAVVRDHDGRLPGDVEKLRALPGFGRYTAGAVASIAFGLEAPAVDGNVSRLLARLFAVEGDVSAGAGQAEVWRHAEALAPGEAPGELTQALIELGALVCTARGPRCGDCPVAAGCAAKAKDLVDSIPPPKKRAKRSRVEVTALLFHDQVRGTVVLERQPKSPGGAKPWGGLFADLWCLPVLEGLLPPDAVPDEAERARRWQIERSELAGEVTHVLTHRDIVMRIVRVTGTAAFDERLRPIALDELDRHGVPSMTVRALRAALPRAALAEVKLPGRATKRLGT